MLWLLISFTNAQRCRRNHFRRLSERICFSSSCLKMHIFPLRSLISVKKITCWLKKSSQGCLCIKAAVRIHFLRLSGRFFFVLLLFKNAHFSYEELDFCEKKSHVDRRNLLRDVFVSRQQWEIISLGFQNDFVLFYSRLKMHVFLWGALFQVKKLHMLTEQIFTEMSLYKDSGEKTFP